VLIANTGGDRLHDWNGEYNSFFVPFAVFGSSTVNRLLAPSSELFWYALGASDGADPTRAADTGTAANRLGGPQGEMGIVLQSDRDWGLQQGAPTARSPAPVRRGWMCGSPRRRAA
jgi:hypothetical protein